MTNLSEEIITWKGKLCNKTCKLVFLNRDCEEISSDLCIIQDIVWNKTFCSMSVYSIAFNKVNRYDYISYKDYVSLAESGHCYNCGLYEIEIL